MKRTGTRRRLSITLIEMIIVMILIATITGALAVNYRQSLEKGKVFATQQKLDRLRAIIEIYFAEHPEEFSANQNNGYDWAAIIRTSGLAPAKEGDLLVDGWGFQISVAPVMSPSGEVSADFSSPGIDRMRKFQATSSSQQQASASTR